MISRYQKKTLVLKRMHHTNIHQKIKVSGGRALSKAGSSGVISHLHVVYPWTSSDHMSLGSGIGVAWTSLV